MQKYLFFLFFFFSIALGAEEVCLKEKFGQATAGSYLVIEQNKIFTFFHIHSRSERTILIEEVSLPMTAYSARTMNWKEWFEKGAPGHTAWIISSVNLATGAFEETFSFIHKGWVNMSDANPFLTTLLNLRFQELTPKERRKIGLPPGHNKPDMRPMWSPRLIVNGALLANVNFRVYKARWPADGSELARKIIEIYLPEPSMQENIHYPLCFPYWLEVEGKVGSAKIRVVDSGMDAHSPKHGIPVRLPQL